MYGHNFDAMHACLYVSNNFFTKLSLLPDFPSWADGIAEPCPDMNIEVAGYTVTQ